MKTLVALLIASLTTTLLLAAVGCRQPSITPAATPSPTPTPVSASPTPVIASAPSPIPSPTPTPKPTPTPTPDLDQLMRKLTSDVFASYNQAMRLTGKYRWRSSTNQTADVHDPKFFIGSQAWMLTWRATYFIKAVEYMEAANSLAATGKLKTETYKRPISQEELMRQIVLACQQASDALGTQIKDSYDFQEDIQKWIMDKKVDAEGHYYPPLTTEEREKAIISLNEYFDLYRKDLSELKEKLDSIISENMQILRKKQA